MALSPLTAPTRSEVGPTPVDQVYITDCVQSQSVLGHAGFSIRAASTTNVELRRFALGYPTYELPPDMKGTDPHPDQAPRRLALVHAPGGRMALLHSAYAGRDTRGRPGNYFTHVLIYPRLPLAEALETWGSGQWQTSYLQTGPSELAPLALDPRKDGKLNRDALTSFLTTCSSSPASSTLATTTLPDRLQGDPQRRRDLLLRALNGCLLTLQEGTPEKRKRLYLLAEPGVVAMLLYGVACLLPGGNVDRLTFSTYEDMEHSLREFKAATLIGTFASSPQNGLDREYGTSRGFALDTFNAARCSPEIVGNVPPALNDLVNLAAEGKWDEVRQWHQAHPPGAVSAQSLDEARRTQRLTVRLGRGQVSLKELTDLNRSPRRSLLDQHEDHIWPLIRDASLTDEQARSEFGALLRKRLPELTVRAGELLTSPSWPDWQRHWRLICFLQGAVPEQLYSTFLRLLERAHADPARAGHLTVLRVPLLQECKALHPPVTDEPPLPIQRLLAVQTAEEFNALTTMCLPPSWVAFAFRHALKDFETAPTALDALKRGDRQLLRFFCQDLLPSYPDSEQQALLVALLDDQHAAPSPQALLSSLLENGLRLKPTSMARLLSTLNAYFDAPDWCGYWLANDHLANALAAVAGFPETAAELWEAFCGPITQDLLIGDAFQAGLFKRLDESRHLNKDRIPPRIAQRIDDWASLQRLFLAPQRHIPAAHNYFGACQRLGLDANELLKAYFTRRIMGLPGTDPGVAAFAGLVKAFCPAPDDDQGSSAFRLWLNVVNTCPDRVKAAGFQHYYLQHHVAPQFRRVLASTFRAELDTRTYDAATRIPLNTSPTGSSSSSPRKQATSPSSPSRLMTRDASSRFPLTRSHRKIALASALLASAVLGYLLAFVFPFGSASSSSPRGAQPAADTTHDEASAARDKVRQLTTQRDELQARLVAMTKKLDAASNHGSKLQSTFNEVSQECDRLRAEVEQAQAMPYDLATRELANTLASMRSRAVLQSLAADIADGPRISGRLDDSLTKLRAVVAQLSKPGTATESDPSAWIEKLREACQEIHGAEYQLIGQLANMFTHSSASDAPPAKVKEQLVKQWIRTSLLLELAIKSHGQKAKSMTLPQLQTEQAILLAQLVRKHIDNASEAQGLKKALSDRFNAMFDRLIKGGPPPGLGLHFPFIPINPASPANLGWPVIATSTIANALLPDTVAYRARVSRMFQLVMDERYWATQSTDQKRMRERYYKFEEDMGINRSPKTIGGR